MPAVTDSSGELTHFANCHTIGLLEITYPSDDDERASTGVEAVPARPRQLVRNSRDFGKTRRLGRQRGWRPDDEIVFSRQSWLMESYSEPAVLWRLRHKNGDHARATLIPGSPASTLVFLVNDRLDRGENFTEWAQALARAEVVRQDLLDQGWTVEA